MSIRIQLILTFLFCLFLACVIIVLVVFSSAKEAASESFHALATSQLERVEERINTFLEPGTMSIKYLAAMNLIKGSRGKLTNYLHTKETTTLYYANHPTYEKRIYDEFLRIHNSNYNYGLVFMANDDGQYAQAPEGHIKSSGYDPRLRSWYVEAMQDTNEITVTSPYLTTGGGMVCSIMVKTYDFNGKLLGLLGVDYSLQSLIEDLDKRRILQTGYLVLFDSSGRIIADGLHPEYVTMDPKDYPSLRKRMAEHTDEPFYGTGVSGIDRYVVVHSLKTMGWKVAVVFEKEEVFESSYNSLKTILITFVIVFVIAFGALTVLARNIVKPIERLTEAAAIISSGEYETSETIQEELNEKLRITGQSEGVKLSQTIQLMLMALQERIEAAVAASNAKSDFLSNMSHEMRTPMNAIIGMTAIGQTTDTVERKDYAFGKIADASKHLLGVINDILDMSKIEANKLELSVIEFNFEKMLQNVINVTNFRVEEKHQNISVQIDKNIPANLIADEQRLAQVITNLLSNAIKFTHEEGDIRLDTHFIKEENGVCTIQFDVIDSGIGLSKEQQERLFIPFQQAENSTSRKFGGTGLGLTISKHITEMMNGAIWVESELDKGSTFSFKIQAQRGSDSVHKWTMAPASHWKNMRILAIDGTKDVRKYFLDLTKEWGVACDTASNSQEALAFVGQKGSYDIYFIDMKTANVNGLEFARNVKTLNKKCFVVVLISDTEWNTIADEAKAIGVNAFLSKPLFPSTIVNCVNEFLNENGSHTEKMNESEHADTFEGYHILLAEDVVINREIITTLLEPTSLSIDVAENGAEALQMFAKAPEKYNMIFMDVQMPEMDGYEATRSIRALDIPYAKTIPIVAMTANVFQEDIKKCLESGMNDHVGKPIDIDQVMNKLRQYLLETPPNV